ncbi:MAG: Ig-like domain repeat protein [Solirubrobacterales bacterium]
MLGLARSAEAAPQSWVFDYQGSAEEFTVPAGVEKLWAVAIGGAGAKSADALASGAGGVSGLTYGTLPVTPGEQLLVWVGAGGSTKPAADGPVFGFGCGAPGGEARGYWTQDGGGGGGASAITTNAGERTGCEERPPPDGVLMVAGGGGGGGSGSLDPRETSPFWGGAGGDGGAPAGAGKHGDEIAPGGCGGCQGTYSGGPGAPNLAFGGGGGGGGGGYRGGQGGGVVELDGGGGGGGGSSYVAPRVERSGFLPGNGAGAGAVVLSSLETDVFHCTGAPESVTVPAGAGVLRAEAAGGHGAGGPLGGAGGFAGTAMVTVEVHEGEQASVYVGCAADERHGGWGYGSGGEGGTSSEKGIDGGGGGGSSSVVIDGKPTFIAAGGGGGGGNGAIVFGEGKGNGFPGGKGGDGGSTAGAGESAKEDGAGRGGRGGWLSGSNGGAGHHAANASEAGGGGGGGAGWFSGEGGGGGRYSGYPDGGGGGGGGGGEAGIAVGALSYKLGTSELGGDGEVEITFLPPEPATVSAYGGSKQETTIGAAFPHPLEALVTDKSGQPVPEAEVVFALPPSGAGGAFDGGGTTESAATGANGVAVSGPVTANLTAGQWEARATVSGVETPAGFTLTNRPSTTATHLTASLNPARPTEPVTFTATVHAASQAAGKPSGAVQFVVNGVDLGAPVALSGGTAASIPVSGLTADPHEIEARYEPTPDYLPSTGLLELLVEKTVTSTRIASSLNPALPAESMTFTATVAVEPGSTPYAGSVQFSVDGTPLGGLQPVAGGTATSPSFETTAIGPHFVVAQTLETDDFLESKGETIEMVDPDGVAIEVDSSANPSEYGTPLQLEAEVSPRASVPLTPSGTVELEAGGQSCTGTLAAGAAACSLAASLAAGQHEVDASYSGDADFEPSSGRMVQRIAKARTATDVAGSPAGESVYGEAVTLSAAVERSNPGAGTPSGTAQFALDADAIGAPVALGPGGEATSAAVQPNAGPHVITTVYGGDANFRGSTGTAPYRVKAAPTTVALSTAPEPSQPGQAVTFSANVAAAIPGGGTAPIPTGSVQFRVDGIEFDAPVGIVDGHAVSPAYERFMPGRHDVAAVYEPGSGNFAASRDTLVHEVDEPTALAIRSTANPSNAGETVTATAHVTPLAPAGTIDFSVDGAPAPGCQAVTVQESAASCLLGGLGVGNHDVRAAYSGAPLFDSARGALLQEVVGLPGPILPECALRQVRGRMLVHRKHPTIRLVAHYRASAPGLVKIRFFARRGEDRPGRPLATLERRFQQRGIARLTKHLPAGLMRRLRDQDRGFIAQFAIPGDPGYCAEAFSKDLGIRRQVDGQLIWFQTDSARAALPKNGQP